MGITIQAYRCRIGNFLPNKCTILQKNNYNNSTTRNENYPTDFNIIAFLLLTSVLLSSFLFPLGYQALLQSNNQSYSHPLYPTPNFSISLHQCSSWDAWSGKTSSDIACNFLISYGINTLAASSFKMITNFQSRYLHGNRRAGGIKLSHWNKGPGFMQNKIPEIKNIIDGLHPHIIGISEANLHQNHDQKLVQLEDYSLHTCPTISNPSLKTSRVIVYTHKSLVVKLRPDLMCDEYSSIWMEVGLPRHKKFIVGQTCREWQLPNQPDRSSLAVSEQLNRWEVFLSQWEKALDSGLEVHVLGDLNMNHCNWTDLNLPASNQTSKLRSLISALFTRILPYGVSQHVVGPTRHWPGQISTGLDHYYTNRPNKLSPVQTQHYGGSDHMLVHAVRYSRSIRTSPRYVQEF